MPAIDWLNSIEDEQIILPGFVVMELISGCRNKKEHKELEKELTKYQVGWPSHQTCNKALSTFSKLHLSHGIGILDSLIGQLALSLNASLYTFNHKHYSTIPNLKTFQPYPKS